MFHKFQEQNEHQKYDTGKIIKLKRLPKPYWKEVLVKFKLERLTL